jgi:hypothetical protein
VLRTSGVKDRPANVVAGFHAPIIDFRLTARAAIMPYDPEDGRRPSGTSVPPELVVGFVAGAAVLLATAIVGGVLLLNATRPPGATTPTLPHTTK